MVDPVRNTASDEAVNFNRCAVRFDPALPAWGEPVGMMIRTGKRSRTQANAIIRTVPRSGHRQRRGKACGIRRIAFVTAQNGEPDFALKQAIFNGGIFNGAVFRGCR